MHKFKLNLILLAFIPICTTANQYVSVIKGIDESYNQGNFSKTISYTEWINSGNEYDCQNDIEAFDLYYGKNATQTTNCKQNQTRNKTITITYESGAIHEEIVSENRIISNEKTQNIVGTHLEKTCKLILDNNYSDGSGNYFIKPENNSFEVYCDMEVDGGGWTMVASNSYNSNIIAKGTGRNNNNYRLDRADVLGVASPMSDFIIGSGINQMDWTQARITMYGFNDLNNSYSYPNNLGRYMDIKWVTKGNSSAERLNSITPLADIQILGSNNFEFHSYTKYFVLDAVRKDSGYNANSNQATVGGAGVTSSDGDPSGGTYFGHGANEDAHSIEGAYIKGGSMTNSTGYVTWIR